MSEASQFRQYADDAPLGRKCDNGKRETVAHRACAHLGGSSSYEPESHARGQLHFDRPQYSPVAQLAAGPDPLHQLRIIQFNGFGQSFRFRVALPFRERRVASP